MTNPPENSRSFDWRRWLPWLLFAFALFVRLVGINWGLPNKDRYWSYHPDEPLNLMYARQVRVGAGDFDPGFYNYGTLFLTISSIADTVVGAYAPLPKEPTRADLALLDARSTLAARCLNAVAGAGTVVLVFLMLRRWQSLLASAIGAMLLAVAPGHVVHSRFMTVDVSATFWIAASLYAAFQILPAPEDDPSAGRFQSWKWPLLAGLFAGLSAGTKYNGALVLIALCAVLAMARPRLWPAKIGAALVACMAAFFASTPGSLTNNAQFVKDLKFELAHSKSGHGLVFEGMPPSGLVHLTNLIVGIGLISILLSIAGLAIGSRSKSPAPIAMALFVATHYLMLSRAELAFLRYTFPMYVGIAFGLGWFVGTLQANEKLGKAMAALAMLGVGGLPFGDGLMATGRYTVAMAGTDSRDAVIRYFNAATASTVRVGAVADLWFYSPPYFPEANAPRFVPEDARESARVEGPFSSPARPEYYMPAGEAKSDWDVRLLTESKPEFVVFSSFEMGDLERLSRQSGLSAPIQSQVDQYKAFILELEKSYEGAFFAGFPAGTVHDMDYIRPQIWVWKRKAKS